MPTPRKPLLIVPIRDRRQRRRILTIRNCAISMLSVAVVIAAISIYNDAKRGAAGDYGRLFGSQVPVPSAGVPRKVDIINEAPVPDQGGADPMLAAPAAREQVLLSNSNVTAATATQTTTVVPASTAPSVIGVREGRGTTIVGDGAGVAVVHPAATSTAHSPVLTGGIFKQQ